MHSFRVITPKNSSHMKAKYLATLLALAPALALAVIDGVKIESLTGLKGTLNATEGVFKVTAPRTDIKVNVDGWSMPPFMGLTAWAAFKSGGKAEAMVMGDLVLLQDEVNPVISVALDSRSLVMKKK